MLKAGFYWVRQNDLVRIAEFVCMGGRQEWHFTLAEFASNVDEVLCRIPSATGIKRATAALTLIRDAKPVNARHAFTDWLIPATTFAICAIARDDLENEAAGP